jgi:hypothetical protein
MPFGHPAPASPASWLGHHDSGFRRLCVPRASFESRGLGPRRRAPLPRGARFLNLDVVRGLLQPVRRADTPAEPSILARERGFRPTTRRHTRYRLRWPRRCVAAPGAGEPRSARDGFHRLGPLAWRTRSRAEALEPRRTRSSTRACVPLLVAPRAPGSPARLTSRPGRPEGSSDRPRSFLNTPSRKDAPSRESRCLPSQRSPCAIEDCSSRAPGPELPHAASFEALLRSSRAFCDRSPCPLLTKKARLAARLV